MKSRVVVVGAGINGLIAAHYLQRAGFRVTMVEQADRVGGACVSDTITIDGKVQTYALGASVLGLMQDFIFEETGLARRLRTFVPSRPKLVHFHDTDAGTRIYRDSDQLQRELEKRWGERGDVAAFRADEARVVAFLQDGYRNARPPTLSEAEARLGPTLTTLWIRGSAWNLLHHYFTAERTRVYMAMTVTESGPVSLHEPYSAFTIPLMDSGSVFEGYYGFVEEGIWRITEELGQINARLGVDIRLSSRVESVSADGGWLRVHQRASELRVPFDYLIFATDPLTAARLIDPGMAQVVAGKRMLGSSGKVTMFFRQPVRWQARTSAANSGAAFRFIFSVDNLAEFEKATLAVTRDSTDYAPGYIQVYCEGAAMRRLNLTEPFDRLTLFFKNMGLSQTGDTLVEVENAVKSLVYSYIENSDDCVWSRLLTPRDLQHLFHFPGGNLDHTMLVAGQTFFERQFSAAPEQSFYNLGHWPHIFYCGAGAYPCGSIAGTPGYMCARQLSRQHGRPENA